MHNTSPLRITLPHEMAAMVKVKVASVAYATASEPVCDGLRALLRKTAILSFAMLMAVPASAGSIQVVFPIFDSVAKAQKYCKGAIVWVFPGSKKVANDETYYTQDAPEFGVGDTGYYVCQYVADQLHMRPAQTVKPN